MKINKKKQSIYSKKNLYIYCYVKNVLYICIVKIKEIITIKTLKIMTTTIFYNGKSYSCEFVKNVSSEDIKGNLRIYASRHDRRVFLVTEFNEVLATEKAESYQIDALLDDEDIKMLDFTALWFCVAFGEDLGVIIRND